jgi:Coenzyme PQQ synthesis protein D (PqqD)
MGRKTPDPLAGVNLLDVAPVRLAAWQERDGRAVLERPRPRSRGLKSLLDRLAFLMATRSVRLDAIGSSAWKRFDGAATVAEVAGAIREEFGEAAEPAEERLGYLVRLLRREGMVGYPGWDETPG